ncbi:universal stress protein [Streptomyces sp. NPDC099050]|uniref:universal stress protein n=1 Tax=Streptomyces sp. NPDC099050 TaxID=3366100 RepID=UPI00382BF6EF
MQTNSAAAAPVRPARPVLAAVDGSEHSLRTLDWALDTARTRGAELYVAHVRPDAPRIHAHGEAFVPPPGGEGDPVLDAVRERLAGRDDLPPVTCVSRDGTPSATLIELAAGAQLLVMGSRGLGGFASLLLGSNSRVCAAFAEARRRGAVLQVVSTHLVPLSSLTLVGSLVAERGGGHPPGTAGGEATEAARELAENQRT